MTHEDRIIRAARELRNLTCNLCLDAKGDGDSEPLEAWEELDEALRDADDAAYRAAMGGNT